MARILIAEDDRDLREAIGEILETAGHAVTRAANGRQALAAFHGAQAELILSDIVMPEMDGYALVQAVRNEPGGAAVSFLLLGAPNTRPDPARAQGLGADDYLFKPFAAADLERAVRLKLEQRRAVQALDGQAAHLQSVAILAGAIEARDQCAAGHLERVRRLARALGQFLGWSAEALTILEYGAALHDLGKIGVPRSVLNKAGSLSPAEWAVIRKHPALGADLLAAAEHLRPALPYVLHHHERWDGRGYPAGLAGPDIPREGRLLAVVDAFDAMTTTRPYRAALTEQAALAEIRSSAGLQFDPEFAAALFELRRSDAAVPSAS